MTLNQFRASARVVEKLEAYPYLGFAGPGRIYEGDLVINGTEETGYKLQHVDGVAIGSLYVLEVMLFNIGIDEKLIQGETV